MLTDTQHAQLKQTARQVRQGILDSIHAAKSGHPGGSLGAADIFTMLFFKELNIDPKNPKKADRDRFVLSKGHTAPGMYASLALRGFFPKEDLISLRKIDSHLQGHPSMHMTPGVDMSTGSLGQGISVACGMALGAKLNGDDYRVYTLMGDGETQEGQCWEAFMFAAHYKLDNLCAIIDINGLQIDGTTAEVMNPEPLDKKLEAFGFAVFCVNGHDLNELNDAFAKAREQKGKPSVILAKTAKGSGVSFMENKASWHGTAPSDEQYAQACAELAKLGGES